ncbi:MAG: sodium:proton exchanger [Micrococcales bacterium]|nr:sodium:proton exchanger [Micrococcales bacterium]
MSERNDAVRRSAPGRGVPLGRLLPLVVAVGLATPAMAVRLAGAEPPALFSVLIYGAAFIGAALLLAWGTELAQLDLPRGLAVSMLALIAILPEYAVDLLFAFQAGSDPSRAPLALANMTGANRLLIGVGWSLVVLVAALGFRRARRGRPDQGAQFSFQLGRLSSVDVVLLAVISLYSLNLLFRPSLTLLDSVILIALFVFYVARLWRAPKEVPEFIGPPALISRLSAGPRRTVTVLLMVVAAAVILLSAEPFSGSLISAGDQLGVDSFLMVQWIAPLATETAELIPACIFAWRQSADEGLGTLLSSKINQWSLLVGAVPLAFLLGGGGLGGLPMDPAQRQELFLTAAQSVFAVSLLTDRKLSVREAVLILLLFLGDFIASVLLSEDTRVFARIGFAALYLVLALLWLTRARRRLPRLFRDALIVPPAQLVEKEPRRA